MIRALPTSASGLQANQQSLHASAHNTANLTTKEATKVRVQASELPQGGVQTRGKIAGGAAQIEPVEEAVEQITAAQHFKARARSVQTQDEMLGVLLDIRA
tara:strand:+ start:108 stop:410 length:303 start_codon:yes stop_codon:yes gene_type:complete